jgi:VIT1/CCC1 family predicted Fe2+/Mn2+ transporter
VLEEISSQELEHYSIWKKYTGHDIGPDMFRVWYYYCIARLLGITFAIKLMEGIEKQAQDVYRRVGDVVPEVAQILAREESHERDLIGLLDEEKLRYTGSVVLGLNDALVEFTGSLAGFTFALQDSRIIAMAGLIMGIAASLSMAASEYLSQRSGEGDDRTDPKKASLYTGAAYIVTVIFLVLPFFLIANPFIALAATLGAAVLVILIFTFYISVAKDLLFRQRFAEMAAISLGIAAVSFVIGLLIHIALGVNV